MFKYGLKRILRIDFWVVLAILMFGIILAGSSYAQAAKKLEPTEEDYRTQYDDAIRLADMLRTSSVLLHNKTYTAEQEVELQAWVDNSCANAKSDRDKARALLMDIRDNMESGECYSLNGWDTLCDGEAEMTIKGILGNPDKTILKKQADQCSWCFTFYDVCRLADIPCFILEDCRDASYNDQYICMVYVENASSTGKEWHFVDVMTDDGPLTSRADAYTVMGSEFFPMDIFLDYQKTRQYTNVIFLNKEVMMGAHPQSREDSPYLAYDRDTGVVKTYFESGTLADGEQYYRTEAYVGEKGEAPSGWIETKDCSGGEMTTYVSYAVYGVFLRGRIEKDGTEYDLQTEEFSSWVPYHGEAQSETESAEHKAFALAYWQKLRDKSIKVAAALLEDENYIWDDIDFSEEDEAYIRKAVEEALTWENIDTLSNRTAFESAGISLDDEDPDHLSEKAKAQAILCYINKKVEPVEHGPFFTDSIQTLKDGVAICDGMNLLCRDMCVIAGIPCFRIVSAKTMNFGDSFFVDHGANLLKADGEWFFCDLMGSRVLGKGSPGYAAGFMEGYDTLNKDIIWLEPEMMRKNHYYKWSGRWNILNYYDFDSKGELGIYQRDRFDNPVVNNYDDIASSYPWLLLEPFKTDENGKYLTKNGLYTVDLKETNEEEKAEVVMRYAYYYQNCRLIQGKQVIDGTEYHFGSAANHSKYHKVGEVSRKYIISGLTFQPMEDQPYDKDGVCPVPEIYHGDKKLELGKDFKIVEYMHNKEVTSYADASYRVEGIGDYTGNATRYFKIVKADISDMDVRLSETNYVWTPGKNYYKPEVKFDLNWQDYDVAYYDYDKPGKAKVVITGKRNYKGSVTKYYDIAPCVWDEKDIRILDRYMEPLQSQEFSYRFRPVEAEAKVFWFDEKENRYGLTEGVDYDLSYSDTDKPGIVTVTATAKGNYQGSVTCTYKINKYDIGDNDGVKKLLAMGTTGTGGGVKVIYTGSPVLPVMPDFSELEEGVHYTMTVRDNVNVGTAKITLQGIGDCTGTYEKEFQITPYVLSEYAIEAEYTDTTYNGEIQKPLVTIKGKLLEGRDYFITYEKEVDGEYQEAEPKEAGKYRIVVQCTDNVQLYLFGVSDEDAPNCYYIDYRINDDGTGGSGTEGSGSGSGNTGSGTEGSGSGSGNTGSGTEGSGSGSGNTGSGTAGSGSGSGNTGSGTAGSGSGSGSTGSGTAGGDNAGTGSGAAGGGTNGSGISTTGADKDDVSAAEEKELITGDSAYQIKKLKASPKKKAIKLKWAKVKKAKGYQIQISLYKNYRKAKTVMVNKSKTSYTLKKLKKNKKYYIRIRAYKGTTGKGKDKKKVYGKWKTATQKTK